MSDAKLAKDFVNVFVRVKPQNADFESCLEVIPAEPAVVVIPQRQQSYSIDQVFQAGSSQQEVYDVALKPIICNVIAGYNCTVIVYGQTGSGKTYTMGCDQKFFGNLEENGLIIRAVDDILSRRDENVDIRTTVSFFEIYNERQYDLLTDNMTNPLPSKGSQSKLCDEVNVDCVSTAMSLLAKGMQNRHKGETKQNAVSSRSHAIFTITCYIRDSNNESVAKLNLVDLAGTESVKRTNTEGSQFKEGVNINRGLLCIGQVMKALSTNNVYVPYRDSAITTALKDSLSKNSFITLIACVSPNVSDTSETAQTLDFSQHAKKMRTKPELNALINEHAKTNPLLLSAKRSRIDSRPYGVTASSVTPLRNFRTPLHSNYTPLPNRSVRQQVDPICSTFLAPDRSTGVGPYGTDLANLSTVSSIAPLDVNLSPIIQRCVEATRQTVIEEISKLNLLGTPRSEIQDLKMGIDRLAEQLQSSKISQQYSDLHSARVESNVNQDNDDANFKMPPIPQPRVRRSVRLAVQASSPLPQSTDEIIIPVRRSKRLSMRIPCHDELYVQPLHKTKKAPVPKPRKKKVAPLTIKSQLRNVLEVLNSGSEKDIRCLATVGPKTAMQILSFRSLRGGFKQISDLEKFPWKGEGYKRFLEANFIKSD